jgi:hypothetical protein
LDLDRTTIIAGLKIKMVRDAADFLSDTAVSTLRSIAEGNNKRLHKQAVNTLSKYDFIKPFRKKWRLTPKGERAVKYHAEKDAFHAMGNGERTQATAGL